MTNRWTLAFITIILCLGLLWLGRFLRKVSDSTSSFQTFLPSNLPQKYIFPPEATMANLEIQGRKVIGSFPAPESGKGKAITIMNKVSQEWKEGVEQTLKTQGGTTLKDIQISKLDSFIWSVGGNALNVESVRISVTNEKGETTKFHAMVDSQSGKIIQTWNQPVIDPLNPRDNPGVKIDPRYMQD